MFGWGQASAKSQKIRVDPQYPYTDDKKYRQVWRTIQDLNSTLICSASLGSPVICENDCYFAGILVSDGCENIEAESVMNYHSLANFHSWIKEIIRGDSPERDSRKFLVNVLGFSPPDLNTAKTLCVATVISSSYVLTTATCVRDYEESAIAIQVVLEKALLTGNDYCCFLLNLIKCYDRLCFWLLFRL